MKKLVILVVLTIINCNVILGQELECGTLSEIESFEIKTELQTIKQKRSINEYNDEDTLYFRIQLHIFRDNNHTTTINLDSLKADLVDLNRYYSPAKIKFYQCNSIEYIDNSNYYNFHSTDEQTIRTLYNDPLSINIYFARKVYIGSDTYAGYSYRPTTNSSPNFIVVGNDYTRKLTLIHEMGHFMDLLHTHDTINGKELVNGSNCVISGDLCCDTPADPQLSYLTVNSDCQYTGSIVDANGDLYVPDPRNIMSYARKECRNIFTLEQYNRIRNAAYLSNRLPLCSHTTKIISNSITTNTIFTDDYIIIRNSYLSCDSIKINACKEVLVEQNVVLNKGVFLQPSN